MLKTELETSKEKLKKLKDEIGVEPQPVPTTSGTEDEAEMSDISDLHPEEVLEEVIAVDNSDVHPEAPVATITSSELDGGNPNDEVVGGKQVDSGRA